MAASTALVLDSLYRYHLTGDDHPERPERYETVAAALEREGLAARLGRVKARAATDDEAALVHSKSYLHVAKRDINAGMLELSTGDTNVSYRSWEVAMGAAGGVLAAVDAVMTGVFSNVFCVVRPPGHHATPTRGMGFCVVNNVAIGARYAQRKHGVDRVLIVDWDVHHGNGTQDAFYDDGSVFFFSTHQWPWYPGTGRETETGEGAGKGATLNCPLPAGSGRDAILGAFSKKLKPAMDAFKPGLVIISAGFDSRREDPLGRFVLTDSDFADLTGIMMEMAAKHAGGRVVSVLEGGYNLAGLQAAALAHVRAFAGDAGK